MKATALAAGGLIVLATALAAGAQEVAEGTFRDAKGMEVGRVTIEHMPSETLLYLKLHDLPPGEHAVHLHAVGKCEPPFDSAGPHFNPTGRKHGKDNPEGAHMGDLPNVKVGTDGKAEAQFELKGLDLKRTTGNSLLDGDGASVVIHAGPDDYKTDPSGNSGARIACAVVDLRRE